MHAPDGFLTAGTAVATGAISAGTLGYTLRRAKTVLTDAQVPLAGIAAAFIFAAQMFNFPVAAGTTGHLLGGALAAVLLGPTIGVVVVSVVVIVQALAFADGGLTALGYNVLNMAIVTSLGGYVAYVGLRKILPRNAGGVIAASGLAAGISVVLSSMAFSVEWLFGASVPIPFDTVFGAMVGVHALIGIGEGVLTGLAVGAVMAARPDLVFGAKDLPAEALRTTKVSMRAFAIGGLLVAVLFATVISQFAVDAPDGLERAAEDTGFIQAGEDHALGSSLFADYATTGVGNEQLSLALAGITGLLLTLAIGGGLILIARGGSARALVPAEIRVSAHDPTTTDLDA